MRLSIIVTSCLYLISFNLPNHGSGKSLDNEKAPSTQLTDLQETEPRSDVYSEPCSLKVNATITRKCRQHGLVQVDVVVTSESGDADGFSVFVDGLLISGSPFTYDLSGSTALRIFLPGVKGMHQIFIHDMTDVGCTAIVPIESPDSSDVELPADCDSLLADAQLHCTHSDHAFDLRDASVSQSLTLFPNPASSDDPKITLQDIPISDYGKLGRLSVYTMSGGLIDCSVVIIVNQVTLQLQHGIPGGVYFIILHTDKNIYSGRLVVR